MLGVAILALWCKFSAQCLLILECESIRVFSVTLQVYALTKERDMLRREQNRKSDSSMLLKEKDEIIKAVMAEGQPVVLFPVYFSFIYLYLVLYKLSFSMILKFVEMFSASYRGGVI
jgi:hypothetical protein